MLFHSSLRRSCRRSLERHHAKGHKIKLVYLYYLHSHGSKGKLWGSCSTEPAENHHPVDTDPKTEPVPPLGVPWLAVKATSGLCRTGSRGRSHREGRTCGTRLIQPAACPRETEFSIAFGSPSCRFLPHTLVLSSSSVQSDPPSMAKSKTDSKQGCLLSCMQVAADHVSAACECFFCSEGKIIHYL